MIRQSSKSCYAKAFHLLYSGSHGKDRQALAGQNPEGQLQTRAGKLRWRCALQEPTGLKEGSHHKHCHLVHILPALHPAMAMVACYHTYSISRLLAQGVISHSDVEIRRKRSRTVPCFFLNRQDLAAVLLATGTTYLTTPCVRQYVLDTCIHHTFVYNVQMGRLYLTEGLLTFFIPSHSLLSSEEAELGRMEKRGGNPDSVYRSAEDKCFFD